MAEKEVGSNGVAQRSDGMLTQITTLFAASFEREYQTGSRDVLGNTVQSAREAVKMALERLGIPKNIEEKNEKLFYEAFLRYL